LPEFFERRFGDGSRLLRLVSATFILIFYTFYASSGLVAGGKLFQSVFHLPYGWAVAAGAWVVIIYTFVGGFMAVSWTDVLQGGLMVLALVLVPLAAIDHLGGAGAAMDAVRAANPELLSVWTDSRGNPLSWIALFSLLGWGLGYFGQPHILARFMAIDRPERMGEARRIAMIWVALGLTGALLIGFAGIGMFDPPLSNIDSEKVYIFMVGLLLHPLVAGVCLSAILAAIMSTADSQLLVASSTLAEDFYKGLLRKNARPEELLWVGRGAVIAISLIASGLAFDPESKVLDLVAYAWAGFGASFGPTLLGALFWSRMTRNGALAGILGGGLTVILWKQRSGGIFDLYEIVPGFAVSAVLIVAVSLLGNLDKRGSSDFSVTPERLHRGSNPNPLDSPDDMRA
jgi:sodium/proline symporter